ncbi:MAG: DUF362 domain-containing protein [Armatimonadetes bacterium]|nr:DUF362 domain-containing protein [Armatimonadota bacterium]
MDGGITRRQLLAHLCGLGVGLAGLDLLSNSQLLGLVRDAEAKEISKVAIAAGGTIGGRVARAVKALGGMERFVRKGAKVVIKPNVGWARTPEQAANTNPAVVSALIGMCFRAGASQVTVYEHTCDNYLFAFRESGIKEATVPCPFPRARCSNR